MLWLWFETNYAKFFAHLLSFLSGAAVLIAQPLSLTYGRRKPMFGNFFGAAAFVTFWLSVACFYIGLYGIGVIGIILAGCVSKNEIATADLSTL